MPDRQASIPFAAILAVHIASVTVAAPVATSPAAKTPGQDVISFFESMRSIDLSEISVILRCMENSSEKVCVTIIEHDEEILKNIAQPIRSCGFEISDKEGCVVIAGLTLSEDELRELAGEKDFFILIVGGDPHREFKRIVASSPKAIPIRLEDTGNLCDTILAVYFLSHISPKEHREALQKDNEAIQERLRETSEKLKRQYQALHMIIELTDTLQQETKLDRILHILLTAITAREGLQFNRAFLLLVDEKEGALVGKYAIGPSTPEEAQRIWANLPTHPRTLSETLRAYYEVFENEDAKINETIKKFRIPLNSNHFLLRVLNEGSAVLVSPDNKELWDETADIRETLGSPFFAVVPLRTFEKPQGVIIVDNLVTKKPITESDLELLRAVANHASFAIERSMLTEELQKSYQELEKAYAELRENQEKLVLAEKLSAVGTIAAQIAHEIRNPIVAIGGFARAILRDYDLDENLREKLEIILEETQKIERTIQDALDFSKFSEPEKSLCEIGKTIHDVIIFFEPEIAEKKITVSYEIADDIPKFEYDEQLIRQVLINLFRNSISVLGEGGKIGIKAYKEGEYCWIEFSDNGPGVPEGVGDKIFQPFFTTKPTGTGLGLSISAQIIEAHKGEIWYKNNPVGGVTFYIRLPLKSDEKKGDNK